MRIVHPRDVWNSPSTKLANVSLVQMMPGVCFITFKLFRTEQKCDLDFKYWRMHYNNRQNWFENVGCGNVWNQNHKSVTWNCVPVLHMAHRWSDINQCFFLGHWSSFGCYSLQRHYGSVNWCFSQWAIIVICGHHSEVEFLVNRPIKLL